MRQADRGLAFSARSFRDPSATTFVLPQGVFRVVDAQVAAELQGVLATGGVQGFVADGRLIGTRPCPVDELDQALGGNAIPAGEYACFRHDRVAFPSFAYEWPAAMLHAAGRLTLDLARTLLAHGYGLKDATPFNVLFRGPKPVFVDVTSIEARRPGDPLWMAEGQFLRSFLLPLLLERDTGLGPRELFLSRPDGIEPADAFGILGPLRALRGPALRLVALPTLFGGKADRQGQALYASRDTDPPKARFILDHLMGRLGRLLDGLTPRQSTSAWTGYVDERTYGDADLEAKATFVERALDGVSTLLDVGCNTGEFSLAAAARGCSVVAVDSDAAVVGRLWARAAEQGLDILPLVVDVSQPTPGTGFLNAQFPSFLDRCDSVGGFDGVLMLAVIHHLMVSAGLPLRAVVDLAARLTRRRLVLEIVLPEDPMFRRIARGREDLFADLTREAVLTALARRFDVVDVQDINQGTRCLVSCDRKEAAL
ncbi:MAG: class I SAM-dependent methyltransferase [Actinomycetota bacterium]